MEIEPEIHVVTTTDSPEFAHLTQTLHRTTILGLDAEWKPIRDQSSSSFPDVTLLQLACHLPSSSSDVVFLLDLSSLPLPSLYPTLKEVFSSPDVLKLGFRFKQDLLFLSHTFSSRGCLPAFYKVEPYMDISSTYHYLQCKQLGGKVPKETKSLANICKEVLGISLSKELQCSDWSHRPLTEEQIKYAAMDAHCLLRIFNVFQAKVANEAKSSTKVMGPLSSETTLGLKEILDQHDADNFIKFKNFEALDIIKATISSEYSTIIGERESMGSRTVSRITMPMEESLLQIVRKYGEKILLRQSDRKPKSSKKKGKRKAFLVAVGKRKQLDNVGDWQGPAPWDLSSGGDGCPKFLCDVMVEGLAKHLRCIGIDAAIPYSKKPEPRELINQAYKEQRVLLTRDAKLLRYQYLIRNQIYRVKSLLKNEQLLEVIETFELRISEDQLMSRCTKCNGRFIQKPLTTEEAVEAAKGFQKIPNCLFDKNLEFWKCMECNQLYWEGTQYHNAIQKFIDVCKLNE